MVFVAFVKQRQFASEFGQHLCAVLALALRLGRIEAQHIAFTPLAVADPDLLDREVVGHLAVAAWPGEHLDLDALNAAHRHRQHVAAKAAAEFGQVVSRVHRGIADEQAAAKPPSVQVLLDAGDGGDVGGVARQHPRAHRHAVAGDRHGDDDLRIGVASLLAVATLAQRREQAAAPQLAVPVRLVDFEVGGGGVVEDQVDIEAQQVGAAQEHGALDFLGPDGEKVEGTIELVDGQFVRLRQPGDVGQPAARAAQFRARVVEALRRHGEQGPLVRRAQLCLRQAGADGLTDAEFLPQGTSDQYDTEFEGGIDLDVGEAGFAADRQGAGVSIDDAVDGGDQALQGGFVELIGAAEVVDDLRFGALGLGVPDVLGEGVVGDGGAIAVTPLGDAQIHAYDVGMRPQKTRLKFSCACVWDFGVLSAAAVAKTQENRGFPGAAPGRVCPKTANPGMAELRSCVRRCPRSPGLHEGASADIVAGDGRHPPSKVTRRRQVGYRRCCVRTFVRVRLRPGAEPESEPVRIALRARR